MAGTRADDLQVLLAKLELSFDLPKIDQKGDAPRPMHNEIVKLLVCFALKAVVNTLGWHSVVCPARKQEVGIDAGKGWPVKKCD